jgi:uroporphyrinogen-III synthase
MTLVLAIRPEPGCTATVEAGRGLGLDIAPSPLFEVGPVAWLAPSPDVYDGLLLGSANAVRHGGAALDAFRGKPAYAVGEATAREAEAAGFPVAQVGQGGLQSLVDTLAPPLRLLRLAGAEHVPLAPPAGIEIETRIAYESVPLALPQATAERLREGALVLFHSAAAARHFAGECERCGVSRGAIAVAALGGRIAAAAGPGWRDVRVAAEPREAALLALARDMCHEPGVG